MSARLFLKTAVAIVVSFEMKRRDNNRQLRPDELDALEDETEEPGVFERASADVIAARRIIKPKR